VYTAGQALFDSRNPIKLLDRSDAPFIQPTEPYERTGQYAQGTTFVEALVPFRGSWLPLLRHGRFARRRRRVD
jgi:predicted GH43/DUF377 family glycosyl hydrolase